MLNSSNNFLGALRTTNSIRTRVRQEPGWNITPNVELAKLLPRVLGPVSCGATIDVKNYNYRNQVAHMFAHMFVDEDDMGPIDDLCLERLVQLAKPSHFGRGGETVYDTNVRNGLEIEGSRIRFGPKLGQDYHCRIGKQLEEEAKTFAATHLFELYGDSSEFSLTAKLMKLTLYQKGGGFDWHADTLHSTEHVATVLVGLPSKFTGGALLVSDGKVTSSYSFQPVPAEEERCRNLSAVAFYTDCLHKVETVESGIRLALQFDLYQKGELENGEEYEDLDISDVFGFNKAESNLTDLMPPKHEWADSFASLLERYFDDHPGWDVGILTRHCYSNEQIRTFMLKGYDAVFYRLFKDRFSLRLLPAMILAESDYDGSLFPLNKTAKVIPLPLDLEKPVEFNPNTVVIHDFRRHDFEYVDSTGYIEHTGNEAQLASSEYFAAVFVFSTKRVEKEE